MLGVGKMTMGAAVEVIVGGEEVEVGEEDTEAVVEVVWVLGD